MAKHLEKKSYSPVTLYTAIYFRKIKYLKFAKILKAKYSCSGLEKILK